MSEYPFTKCLNPRRIVNVYTGESLVVPCGRCPACSLRKSSQNALRCKLETLSHKYHMFVTLTYNNVSLPRMLVYFRNRFKDECGEVCDSGEQAALIDITQRLGTERTLLGHSENPHTINALAKKVNLPRGILPHLSKYDLQLFIKRLRINLDRYYERKFGTKAPQIRYYACGEYGPVHFRPHYHLSIWFSDDEIYKVIRQIIHKSWQYGRIDCQKSQGKSSDYVSKYLNSSVSLPNVFKEVGTRPFSLHSSHLGEKVLEVSREKVYTSDFKSAITRSIPNISTDSDIVLWRSLKTHYFPKCKGYTFKSRQERLFSYTTYERASKWCKETLCSKITERIFDAIIGSFHHHPDYMHSDHELLDYFRVSSGLCPFDTDENMRYYFQRIYTELLISKHFLNFVCNGDKNLIPVMMDKIEEFWKWQDMENLNTMYRQMEEYYDSEYFESVSDYDYFYWNRGFDEELFKETKAFRMYNQKTQTDAENAVKHKELNDKNKIFENR